MPLPRLRLPRLPWLTSHKGVEEHEEQALRFLQAQGLRLRQRNYRCKAGEIDLIMEQDETIVFVEVRFRSGSSHGGAAASVTRAKQRKLHLTASHYLQSQHLNEARQPCRFDVVAYEEQGQCQWYINAFQGM